MSKKNHISKDFILTELYALQNNLFFAKQRFLVQEIIDKIEDDK